MELCILVQFLINVGLVVVLLRAKRVIAVQGAALDEVIKRLGATKKVLDDRDKESEMR